jgi:hypothetical protein
VDASGVATNVPGSITLGIFRCIPLIMSELNSKFPELKNPRALPLGSFEITLVSRSPHD